MQLCWLYLSALFLLIPGNFQVLSSSPLSKIRLLLMFFWLVSSFYLGLRENIKLLERSSLNMPSKIISFFAHSLSIIIYYSLVPDQKCVYVYTNILITRYFMIIYHIRGGGFDMRIGSQPDTSTDKQNQARSCNEVRLMLRHLDQ